ncbi:hypothetical protein [Pelagicoccus sp. SDUM812003]|uniref:hypothetical protein n=1 Tax=Pelagicoccus sp. SDUM812003 TaxID=3041267 RepID=UPI00280D6493|nr:hypothetical protein [Pelagicoccus sp. SDUM812003]MDQ8205721.1 hypothetical protein [Pelagicoccus sp. SDUM812003]
MKTKITLSQHLIHLGFGLTPAVPCFVIYLIIKVLIEVTPFDPIEFAKFLVAILSVTAPPTIYGFALHLNYTKNRGNTMWKDAYLRIRIQESEKREVILKDEEIESYEVTCSPLHNKSSAFRLPWDAYFHIFINTKDGKRFLTTSLVSPNFLEKIEKNTKVVFDKRFFPWISKKDLLNQSAHTTPASAPR